MAYTDIDRPDLYFNTKLYTGNGSTQSITGVGFQPDWVWIKERSSTSNHQVGDAVRGATKIIETNTTNSEATDSARFISFDSDGFTQGANNGVNESGQTYASWNWLADNTSGSSNTDGSITSTVSANTTSGFSIVSYSGNGTNGATVGHGLGVAPKAVIVKARTTGNTQNWFVNYPFGTGDGYIMLNSTNAGDGANSSVWNSTTPNSSTVTLGTTSGVNDASYDYIMYCFTEVKGFSKFGSYVGNGNADGSFIYLGFKPAFVITKRTDSTSDWVMLDNKRDSFNLMNKKLFPNNSDSEYSGQNACDFLSNGFKLRDNATNAFATNISGGTYIYMAFAESPLVGTNNIPAVAR